MIAFRQAFASRDFLKLWGGQIVSGLGDRLDQMGIIALYAAAGSASVTSTLALIAVLIIVPQTLFSAPAGWLADRIDRRWIMIGSDILRAMIVISLPFTFPRYGDTAVYASVLFIGILTSFFNPAKSALIPRLVSDTALPAANGLSATTNIVATLIGSLVGGHLAHALHVDSGASPTPFFLFDMASYLVSAGLVWRIIVRTSPRPAPPMHAPVSEPGHVWPLLRCEPALIPMLVIVSLFWALAAVAYSAINSFAYVRFHGGVVGVGNMQASLGVGMLIGAAVAGTLRMEARAFFGPIAMPLATLALAAAVLAFAQHMTLALLAVTVLGYAGSRVLVAIETGLQLLTPDALRGRLFGIKEQLTAITFVVPSLAFYFDRRVDAHVGPALYACAAVLAVAAAFSAYRGFIDLLERHRRADWGAPWLNRLDGLNRLLCQRFHRLEHEELALPARGAALVVANHLSGLDPLLMIAASPRPLRFMIVWHEYDRWWLRWLFDAIGCIPVGGPVGHRAALGAVKRVLDAGEVVALFPQGGIVSDINAPVRLKRGVVMMAEVSGAPVYPLRLEGIAGVGKTVSAVFVRSRARLFRGDPLLYEGEPERFLAQLAQALAVRSVSSAQA